MTMTLSGSGTIAGLVAGGLPDATITSADLASNAVDSQTLTLLNATGTAPVYACRAWVNFNGTGTVAIRASGNVSSITDLAAGAYTVNFSTAMPDTNYSGAGICAGTAGVAPAFITYDDDGSPKSTTSVDIDTRQSPTGGSQDSAFIDFVVFR